MANKPIFFDASGKRAARLTFIGWVAAAISIFLGAGFVFSLLGLGLGVFMLILDFDFVERGIAARLPERESWRRPRGRCR